MCKIIRVYGEAINKIYFIHLLLVESHERIFVFQFRFGEATEKSFIHSIMK